MNSARASAPRGNAATWIAALLAAAAGAWVFRGSLPYFFAQDDYLGLARARGIAPALTGPWRWIPGQAYFALMRPFGLASAAPYHAVSLAAHALCAALLALWLARRLGAPAGLAGAGYFAAHPSLYTALYSVSGIGEILASLFVVATLLFFSRADRLRWAAVLTFAAALLSKESVLLLPLALPALPATGAATPPSDRRLMLVLGALSVAMAVALFASDVFAVRSGIGAGAAYAISFGPHVFTNAATYVGWAAQPWLALAHGFEDAVEPQLFPVAAIAALLVLAGMAWPRWRRAGGAAGAALFLLLIAPVLPLAHHTYHYYLDAPLIGAALAIAALFASAFGAAREGRAAWAVGIGAAALFASNGAAFVHTIETHPFTDPRLRADALVDRALIAERITNGLAAARLPEGTAVAFWSPWALIEQARAGGTASPSESYAEFNVRAALMDGLAVRVLFPNLGAVSFLHQYRTPPPPARVALYEANGTLRVMEPAAVDSILAAHPIPGARP